MKEKILQAPEGGASDVAGGSPGRSGFGDQVADQVLRRKQLSAFRFATKDRLSFGLRFYNWEPRGYRRDVLEEFIGDTILNTIFMSGEAANIAALPSIVDGASASEALKRLTSDCLQAMAWTYDACQGCHRWFLSRYVLPHSPTIEDGSLVDLTDAPAFEDLRFRVFANADGLIEVMTP